MKTPYVWDGESQKSPIRDYIGHCIADKESIDIHGASWICCYIPLGHASVSTLLCNVT